MGLLGCTLLGLLIGLTGRAALHEDAGPGSLFAGAVGAIVGGLMAPAIGLGLLRRFFDLGSWLLAAIGACAFLAAYVAIMRHDEAPGQPPHGT
jgi:uncharacterized membrane protein YeaQ/YmgE (transglycosylase-associated protein family)